METKIRSGLWVLLACGLLAVLPQKAISSGDPPEQLLLKLRNQIDAPRPDWSSIAGLALDIEAHGNPWSDRASFLILRKEMENGTNTCSSEEKIRQLSETYNLLADHVLMLLARCRVAAGNKAGAIKAIEDLVVRFPESPLYRKALLLQAEWLLDTQQAEAALAKLQPFTSGGYNWVNNRGRLLAAKALAMLNQKSQAVNMLEDIVVESPDSSEAKQAKSDLEGLGGLRLSHEKRFRQGASYERLRNYDRALSLYRELVRKTPGNRSVQEAIGRVLFTTRKYKEALEPLRKADTVEALIMEARALYRTGQNALFAERLPVLEARFPASRQKIFPLRLLTAQDLRDEGRPDEAERLLRDLLIAYPDEAASLTWELGWSAYRRGNFEQAADFFQRAAALDPKNRQRNLYWQSRSLSQTGRHQEAETILRLMLGESRSNYYAFLAMTLLDEPSPEPLEKRLSPLSSPTFSRYTELRLLGLVDEIPGELAAIENRLDNPDDTLILCQIISESGNVRKAILLAEPLSTIRPEFEPFAYPKAHWNIVEEAARHENIDPYLIAAIIRRESVYDPNAKSTAGALGLMQIMPSTGLREANSLKLPMKSAKSLTDPSLNIRLGSHHMARLLSHFDGNILYALAAYNAGKSVVKGWIDKIGTNRSGDEFIEEIPYTETRNYLKNIFKNYYQYRRLWGLTPPPLSAILGASHGPG